MGGGGETHCGPLIGGQSRLPPALTQSPSTLGDKQPAHQVTVISPVETHACNELTVLKCAEPSLISSVLADFKKNGGF